MRVRWSFAVCAIAGAAVLTGAGKVAAQDHTPPSWDALSHCANLPDADDELACYRAAMKAAGFVPNQAVREAEKRRVFGLALPSIRLGHHKPDEAAQAQQAAAAPGGAQGVATSPAQAAAPAPAPAPDEEDEDMVTVELADVALIPPANKLLLVTKDGAVWKQIDSEQIRPLPQSGQQMVVRRTRFGGFFCKFDKVSAVRCVREH